MNIRQVALVAFLVPVALFSQEFRGTISGAVTDPTGAAVPGAKVIVTEIHTGTKVPTVSDSAGQYTAPFLLPGDYDVAVQAPGFKSFTRKGIHVGAGDHAVIDVRLDVGDVTTSVEVTADASQLNTENATVGQAVTTKEVEELPINGRTPMMAASLSLGVIGYAQPTLVHPFDSGGAAGMDYHRRGRPHRSRHRGAGRLDGCGYHGYHPFCHALLVPRRQLLRRSLAESDQSATKPAMGKHGRGRADHRLNESMVVAP